MEEALLQGLVQAVREGHEADGSSFKAQGWKIAVTAVNNSTSQTVDKKVCVTKLDAFKKIWRLWKGHLGAISGWSGTNDKGVPQTDEDIIGVLNSVT